MRTNFQRKWATLIFGPKFAQKWILGSDFQKSKSGFGINTSKILCVPIFSHNGQLLSFWPKFGGWQTFLLPYSLNIKAYICANSKIQLATMEQIWGCFIQIWGCFIGHLYVRPFVNLNQLPIVETVILSCLKRVE